VVDEVEETGECDCVFPLRVIAASLSLWKRWFAVTDLSQCPTCRADVTLPSAAVSGMTLTPVAPPSTGVEVEQPPPPLLARLNASLAALRTRLFGRGSGSGSGSGSSSAASTAADETTPLMSDGGGRRTEGIV
jgi:hypothetical protein